MSCVRIKVSFTQLSQLSFMVIVCQLGQKFNVPFSITLNERLYLNHQFGYISSLFTIFTLRKK